MPLRDTTNGLCNSGIVSLSLDVARSDTGNTRFHFGMGVTFK